MTVDSQPDRSLLERAIAFDWKFSERQWLYNFFLATSWGPRHRKALPHIQGPRVLEVSFGLGYLMSRYAGQFETTGVDYNPSYVEATRRKLEAQGLKATLLEGDAHALPFPDASFNTLLNTDAFTLYRDPPKAMDEFYRVLVPGGRLILMEYDYPKDGNVLGTFLVNHMRQRTQYVDFRALFRSVGFSFEDHHVGSFGCNHMFVATKPL